MPSYSGSSISGLSTQEVERSRSAHGTNKIFYKEKSRILTLLQSILKEPMVLLLLAAAVIYFFGGMRGEAYFMVAAILFVSAISIYQDHRSRNALKALNALTAPQCHVIRDGKEVLIHPDEIVMGDVVVVSEGEKIPADGILITANDFSVNEAMLTGEAMAVYKTVESGNNLLFRGTVVAGGRGVFEVNAVGSGTRLGAIGKSIKSVRPERTPLELQIGRFVKGMVVTGALVFLLVLVVHYYNTRLFSESLLSALTLAMSILPEEIPVAFASFMALGAWRLMKIGVVVKETKTVETLGSATVICLDKTGTITQNRMELAGLYTLDGKECGADSLSARPLLSIAMWASEMKPFDPMEKAIHEAYGKLPGPDERPLYTMIHEYPLSGRPPMMTHVFANQSGARIIAAKGAPEAIAELCSLSGAEKSDLMTQLERFAAKGFRVLGVARSEWEGTMPAVQQDIPFLFVGLVAFYDPPKENFRHVLEQFYAAGIKVKMITGDNALTATAIAQQVGLRETGNGITGAQLLDMSDVELKELVQHQNIFTRMFPEAKLKIIHALKSNQEIVAMTGDGVNDGPALKAAHIGIAMGKKGTEVAKAAASLVLVDDNLDRMVDGIAFGRKIYMNLKKAIQYIISIHIPIILAVSLPLLFGWVYPAIFTPLHVIFFELVMGPTCSIVYENEPLEKNAMQQPPRAYRRSFFKGKELLTSIMQGLAITAGVLLVYFYAIQTGYSEEVTRAMVFTCLMASNVALTLVNRSFYFSVFTTMRYSNSLLRLVLSVSVLVSCTLLWIPPLASFFGFGRMEVWQFLLSIGMGLLFVLWYELVKWNKRTKQ